MTLELRAGGRKTVIAMAHIGALPGAPLYDPAGGMARLIDGVLADVEALLEAPTDELMRHFVLDGYQPHPPIAFKVAV